MKITKLERQKNRTDRYGLDIDGNFFAGISVDLVIKYNLFENKELNSKELRQILEAEEYQKCLAKSYDYLSIRLQSENELRTKLRGKFPRTQIVRCIERLKEIGYIDDRKFTKMWLEQRQVTRGKYLLRQELKKKGIATELIDEFISDHSATSDEDFENAKRIAEKKLRPEMTKDEIFQKIGGTLSRKGYSYDIVKKVLDSLIKQ